MLVIVPVLLLHLLLLLPISITHSIYVIRPISSSITMLAANSKKVVLTTGGSASSRRRALHQQQQPRRRGPFIVFEGVDRCGKTTQSAMLQNRLKDSGKDVSAMRFPDRTTCIGNIINEYLQSSTNLDDRAIHLLFSANRWEASERICQTLQQGKAIVCDRYAYSGVAFSSAKIQKKKKTNKGSPPHDQDDNDNNNEPEEDVPLLSLEWCQNPDRGLPAPDCVIFLDLSQDEAEKRGGYGGERYEKRDMQLRVRQQFTKLQNIDKNGNAGVSWKIIDASQSVEKVHDDVWQIVEEIMSITNNNTTVEEEEEEHPDDDDDGNVSINKPHLIRKMWDDGYIDLSNYASITSSTNIDNDGGDDDEGEKEN